MAKSFLRLLILCVTMLMGINRGWAQEDSLRRRGYLGAVIDPISDSLAQQWQLAKQNGVFLKETVPGGSAQVSGLQAGDVLLTLNDTPVTQVGQFVALVQRHRAEQQFVVQGLRQGKPFQRTVVVRSRPAETHLGFTTLYKSVVVHSSRRRLIITQPNRPGRHPAILFMGGMGCYSIDELTEDNPYGRILAELTRSGFVTMRVEKTGMGDSEGPACSSTAADLAQEVQGYVAGLKALKSYAFVDSNQTFILGHSMGGVTAPLVAGQESVRGVIVSGTIGTSFYEHELDNLRRQLTLRQMGAAQIDSLVRLKAICNYRLYLDHQPAERIRQELPVCVQLPIQPSVPYSYMQQAFDLNLSKLWLKVIAPVLVIYGTSDFRSTADENRSIVNTLNQAHAGQATYVEIADMEHGFGQALSQQASWEREAKGVPVQFHPQVLAVLRQWLCRLSPQTCS